jgi:hypothetical protein
VQGSGPAEAVPGNAGLELPGAGGLELGSTTMTQETVEAAEVGAYVRNVGRADVEKSKEVVEALPEAGLEAVQPESQPTREEPQSQQDRPAEPVVEAEWGRSCHRLSYRWWCQQSRCQPCRKGRP